MKIIDNTPIENFDTDWGDPDGTGMKEKSKEQVQKFIKKKFIGLGYTFLGKATPSTVPATITIEDKFLYIATEEGDYSNFGLGEITEMSVIKSVEGSWVNEGLNVKQSVGKIHSLTNTPARSNLAIDSAGTFKGYKVDLSEMYAQGVRTVIFSGIFYDSSSSVVAGVVVDKEGIVENYTPYSLYKDNLPHVFSLPITEKSSYLWATYDASGSYRWIPKCAFFETENDVLLYDKVKNFGITVDNLKNDIGYNISLTKGCLDYSGEPTGAMLNTRVHSNVLEIVDDISIILEEGYFLAHYLYNEQQEFIRSDETYVSSLSLPKDSNAKFIRFAFRKGDGSSLISIEDNIIKSLTGVYSSQSIPLTIQLKDFKNYIESNLPEPITKELTGDIVGLGNSVTEIVSIDSEDYTIVGSNLLDASKFCSRKILNDSGEEIADGSSYYDCFIPVKGISKIYSSFAIQRLYFYNSNKEWLGRVFVNSYPDGSYTIPSQYNNKDVAFVKVQIQYGSSPVGAMISYNSISEYCKYNSNNDKILYKPISYIYSNDMSHITLKVKIRGIDNTEYMPSNFEIPDVWEPENVDEGYSTPIGRNNTTRANWSAENKYNYYEFLEHYYDTYINNHPENYQVIKKSLGQDSSNSGYELFEYDFRPDNYSKVVMLSAGMNACETSCIWGLATFIRELMEGDEPAMVYLRNNVRFKVLPFICPSSFDEEPLKYQNYNDVRVNKNFSYRRKWYDIGDGQYKGQYPDSENESVILKRWISANSGIADVYIDCHSDTDITTYGNVLTAVICSDNQTKSKINSAASALKEYYIAKGYATEDAQSSIWNEGGTVYPKTLYAYKECNIPSIMIEQYISSTQWGSDGVTNNDAAGIRNYVAMLRLYTYAVLNDFSGIVNTPTATTTSFHCLKNKI